MKRWNTVTQYIATRLIMDLCKLIVQMPGTWVAKRCWDQVGLDLMRSRAAVVASEEEGGQNRWRYRLRQ